MAIGVIQRYSDAVGLKNAAGTRINPATEDTLLLLRTSALNLDITLSSLRDALRGSGTKDLTTLQAAVDLVTTAVNSFKAAFDARDLATQTTLLLLKQRADLLLADSTFTSILGEVQASPTQYTLLERLKTLRDQLDVALSTRASEATATSILGRLDITTSSLRDAIRGVGSKTLTDLDTDLAGIQSSLTTLNSKDFATQTTLAQAKTTLDNIYARLDVALSTRASESTLSTLVARANLLLAESTFTSRFDITLSSLRDALRGAGDKTLTDLDSYLSQIFGRLTDGTQNTRIKDVAGTLIDPRKENGHGSVVTTPSHVNAPSIHDTGNSATGFALAAYAGSPFTPVVGAVLPAATADMFLGSAFDAESIGVGGFGIDASATVVGNGYAIWLDESDKVTAYEITAFAGSGRFYDPRHGARKLVIAFQNTSAGAGAFTSRVVWHRGGPSNFQFPAGAPINPSFPTSLVKNIGTGRQPDSDYSDERTPGSIPEFSTQATLGAGGTFAPAIVPGVGSGRDVLNQPGPGFDSTGFLSITVIVNASHPSATDGLKIEFSNDEFVTISDSFLFTYTAAMVGKGRRFLVPANLGEQFRIRYVNGGTAQTAFDLRTELSTTQVQPMSDDIGRGSLLVSPGLRISQVLKRRHAEAAVIGATASGAITITDEFGVATAAVPAGHVFHVTSIVGAAENADTTTAAIGRIRDGGVVGTLKYPFRINESVGGLGGINETQTFGESFDEPLRFLTDVYFEEAAGTITLDFVAIGYLEPT